MCVAEWCGCRSCSCPMFYSKVSVRLLDPDERDTPGNKRDKSHHNYFKAAFVRKDRRLIFEMRLVSLCHNVPHVSFFSSPSCCSLSELSPLLSSSLFSSLPASLSSLVSLHLLTFLLLPCFSSVFLCPSLRLSLFFPRRKGRERQRELVGQMFWPL